MPLTVAPVSVAPGSALGKAQSVASAPRAAVQSAGLSSGPTEPPGLGLPMSSLGAPGVELDPGVTTPAGSTGQMPSARSSTRRLGLTTELPPEPSVALVYSLVAM